MAANVLNSPQAVEVSVHIVRAFVSLRQTLATHKDLASTLEALERKTETPNIDVHIGAKPQTHRVRYAKVDLLRDDLQSGNAGDDQED